MGGNLMPSVLWYLVVMLVVVIFWFLVVKRPVYEAVFVAFLVLVTMSGTWDQFLAFVNTGISTNLLYSMTAFVAMSIVLTKTKVIDGCIAIILALLGRVPGGAGYVSVLASSFMGALSGSGPGNIMATGAITIPAMKKSGFPAELAANIVSNSSYMGNMIPPSSNIVAALGAFLALYPESDLSTSQFWIIMWGISIWFILHRVITIFVFCRIYGIKAMPKDEIPDLKQALKEHWQGMLLPVLILLPFVLDYLFKDTFFTARLGAQGAKYMSSSALLFIAGVATMYGCAITEDKKLVTPKALAAMFAESIKSIAPTVGVCVFGYMIGALFGTLNVAEEMEAFILSISFGKFGMVLFVCIVTCILGMIIPGSSIVVIFGSVFITSLASVGVDPLLAAAMLPVICGVMCGITPPLGLGLYAGMSIAGSDFDKTFNNNLWWVAGQFVMEVVVLMGMLPILGL